MTKEPKASLRLADAKLRSIVQYAKGNAKAAKIKDDEMTWEAHAREVDRVSKMLRKLIENCSPAVGKSEP
jgi:hypothetical protein